MIRQNGDILLTIVPPWDYEKPPLGVACLATHLKSVGVTVDVLDINIELYNNSPEEIRKKWNNQASFFWLEKTFVDKYAKELDIAVDKILSYNSKILGFSVNTSNSIYLLKELVLRIRKKNPSKIIIVGGPGCFLPHERKIFGQKSVNFFVIGKGEFVLEGLLGKLGIIGFLKTEDKCKITKEQNGYSCVEGIQRHSLDSMPLPTFEEFRLNSYTRAVLPILWSEGCIRSCAFCLDRVFSGTYETSNPSRIIAGIKFYIEKYRIRDFRFVDNLINGNLKYLDEFCCQIIKEGIPVDWDGQIVVRSDMDRYFFEKLKKARCRRLELGVESFSDRVLKFMNKGFLAREAVKNIIDAKTAGLGVCIFIIVGFPGEEKTDFEETIENIKRYHEYIDEIGSLTLCSIPFGTDLYNNPQKYNINSDGNQVSKEFWLKWRTKDNSNNFEVRLRRLEKLKRVLNEFKIPFKDNLELVI